MKTYLAMILGVVMAGTGTAIWAAGELPAVPAAEKKEAVAQAVYVCPSCETMAMNAGKCEKCQKDLVQKHLLGIKDGKAMLCDCSAGCACDSKTMKDGKCACGKEVKTMSCKGMYACACAGGKCCSTMSDKPGKCACGMDMKKVE